MASGVSLGSVLMGTEDWCVSSRGFSVDPDGLISGFTPGWLTMGSLISLYPPGSSTEEPAPPASVCWRPEDAGGNIRKENMLFLARNPLCVPLPKVKLVFPGAEWILGAMKGKCFGEGAGFNTDLVD